jgi:hypothetical protein
MSLLQGIWSLEVCVVWEYPLGCKVLRVGPPELFIPQNYNTFFMQQVWRALDTVMANSGFIFDFLTYSNCRRMASI